MQEINLKFHQYSATSVLFAKQGEVGRKFKATIVDGTIPADAVFSVWFSGASGEGNYTKIDDRNACTVDGNTVTVELITQMLNNKGSGKLCLYVANADGTQLGTWNIPYVVEEVPGMGSVPAKQYYSAWTMRKLRDINTGKLTEEEKSTFASLDGADFLSSDFFVTSNNLPGFASWAYANAGVNIGGYLKSVHNTFIMMFDWYNKAENGYTRKLLEETDENKNYLAMLLPGSYGGGEAMQSHGYRYTMQAQDYKTGDIFCASVKVYTKQGDLLDAYFMAISLGGNTYLACHNYGAGTPFTVTYADIEAVEKITNGLWPYPGVGAGDDEECFPEYYYVLRPENVAAADAISLGKEFQGFKRETKASLAECANAIKGSASGEVVALKDVSPIEHEMSVKVDVPGATVQKLGKNYALTSSANKPINMGAGSLLVSAKQLEAPLKAGHTYTLTADISCDNPDKVYLVQDSLFTTLGYFRNDGRQSLTFTVGANDYAGLYLYGARDLATSKLYAATFENITVCEGTPQNYTADENGIVRGIIGNGESMTLLTDTEGVTIEAEYNKDTNKVIESLVQAIISLGGNV